MTTLTCRQVADSLMAYLDGDLIAPERAAFNEHLQGCDACVTYVRDYQATIELARATQEDLDEANDAPPSLVHAILAARRRQ